MKIIFTILLFLDMNATYSQATPKLEYFCELNIQLDPALIVGETAHGIRRIIPIVGGTVNGPAIKGEILHGGADWQMLRKDGVMELEAHYQFKTDDGVLIYIKNTGLRVASPEVAAKLSKGEKVDPGQYYFRAVPKFEAPIGKYGWINDTIFVCTGERLADAVIIRVWKLL
jgi:Protein of unknown function (DUF3237)